MRVSIWVLIPSFFVVMSIIAAAQQVSVAEPPSSIKFQASQHEGWDQLRDFRKPEKIGEVNDLSIGKFAIPEDIDQSILDEYAAIVRLPPIESYFFTLPESVCYPDERVQVQDTTLLPWSANCQLIITMSSGQQAIGTGWLVGPQVVVTAGHCVHEGKEGEFFESVEVIPGMNGPMRPFGSQVSNILRASEGWRSNGDVALDYGAILLERPFQSETGDAPGQHAIGVKNDTELNQMQIYLSGYPADKQFGSQWTDTDPITQVQSMRLRYMLDTYGGHSGSAVVSEVDQTVVGIHNYGGCPNHGTRITEQVKADIDLWAGEIAN